jgi:iron(III) transport system permease protein
MALETPLGVRAASVRISSRSSNYILGGVVLSLVALATLLPVLILLWSSFNTAGPAQTASYGLYNWEAAFSDSRVFDAIWTTVRLAVTRVTVAVIVGIIFAWLIARTDMPGGSTFEFLFWVAFFTPVLPLTFGWILLLDPDTGLVNRWLTQLPFIDESPLNIYSFWGIIWIHLTATSIPVAVILFTPAFRQMSAALEDSARMCGAGALMTLRKITVPLLVPAILPATVIMLIRSLEAFEIELLVGTPVGINVYSTRIYDFIAESPPQYGIATALGSLFLITIVLLAGFYVLYVRGRRFTTITGQGFSTERIRLGRWRWFAAGMCGLYLFFSFGLSLFFLILGSFMRRFGFFDLDHPFTLIHWIKLFEDPILASSLINSLILGAASAILAVLLFSLVAYVVVRSQLAGRQIVDMIVWVPWATPGVLMGLALVWLYLQTPLRAVLYGSMTGLVLAMLIKELPVCTQLLKAGFVRLGHELEEAAWICGAPWMLTYRRVVLPLVAPVLINVAVLTFQGAVRDIASIIFLYNNDSRPLSILMLEYSFAGEMERGAAVGILLVLMISVMAVIARRLGFRPGAGA